MVTVVAVGEPSPLAARGLDVLNLLAVFLCTLFAIYCVYASGRLTGAYRLMALGSAMFNVGSVVLNAVYYTVDRWLVFF